MKSKNIPVITIAALLAALGGMALAAQDKYTVQVPDGLAFSEFRGYEDWQTVAVSQTEEHDRGDPRQSRDDRRLPGRRSRQRQAFPRRLQDCEDPLESEKECGGPLSANVPDTLDGVGFIEKDSKRFPDTGGWGYAQFSYDPASDTFTPHGQRRQVRVRVPYDSGGKRLHFHGVREEVNGEQD